MAIAIKRLLFFFFILSSLTLSAENICFFLPPKDWSAADPSILSPRVKVGFIGPPSQLGFCPSINLAEEKVACNLQDYLIAVKKIHSSNRHKEWSYLGTCRTSAGEAALTQIDLPSQAGPMRLLQLIFLKDNNAYILTSACLKKEFIQYLPIFRETFQTLQVTDDLYSAVADEERLKEARRLNTEAECAVRREKAISSEMSEWRAFQDFMIGEFGDLGPYWQALAIAHSYHKLQELTWPEEEAVASAEPHSRQIPDLHFFLKPLYHILYGDLETARKTYEKMDCFCHSDFNDIEPLPPLLRRRP